MTQAGPGSGAGCDVLVVGGINTDYIGRAAALPHAGDSEQGDAFVEAVGGKGANQAVAAARLGVRVVLVGAVGCDRRGRRLLAHLRREGVVSDHIVIANDDSGAALVHVDRAGRKQSIAVGAANKALAASRVVSACNGVGRARVVLVQLEVPLPCVVAALRWGRRMGACTVLDPAPARALPDSVLRLVDVIKPNTREAKALTGISVHDAASARRAARRLRSRGVRAALVEAGEDGTVLLTDQIEHCYPRLPAGNVDTSGAGDTMAGALAACTAKGYPLLEAGRLANAAAALEITSLGPQTPRITEARLRRWMKAHSSDAILRS